MLATADGRYRVQLTNINSVRTRERYELLLLLCSFEIFYHDQIIRAKLRPGYEGAPPDFFQSGGSLRPPG